jgi:AcrR family transcriptional regulator
MTMAVKPQGRSRGRPPAFEGEAVQTRRALLDAAAQLIAERGYRGTTVSDIVERSGLSKGTFYWHFKSKEDLLLAVLEERIDRPLIELIERLKTASANEDMAPEATALFLELMTPGRETILLDHEYRALAMRDGNVRRRYAKRQAALRDALAGGLDARARQLGAPPFSVPTADIAMAYLSLGSALAVARLIDASSVPDNLLGETVALVYQGLVARAAQDKRQSSARPRKSR